MSTPREADAATTRPAAMRRLVAAIFEATGAPAASASEVADHLVDANLAGHHSHGVIRTPEYLRDIAAGALDPRAEPAVQPTSPVAAVVDGCWGFGQVAGRRATQVGVELARTSGIAAVGITRCHHLGRMGDYVERAAEAGCIMLATAGGHPPIAIAHGGRDRLFGANPLAAGFPTRSGGSPDAGKEAFVLDMATTSVAAGKVLVAAARGEQLPAGVLVDAEGAPSSDPSALAAGGALTPFGGHKGSALAVLAELLATALVGTPSDGGPLGGIFARQAALLVVLRADLWRPLDDVTRSAAATLSAVRAACPVEPGVRVRAPGDPEREARRLQADGLTIDAATFDALLAAARQLQVEVPDDLLTAATQ